MQNNTDLFQVERALFREQLGLATRAQLLDRGVTDKQLRTAVHRGQWVRPTSGLYALANWPDTAVRRLLAACLLTGGVASHGSAAWLWGLLKGEPHRPDVTVVHELNPHQAGYRNARRLQRGFHLTDIVVHRSRDLSDGSISRWQGIPTTNPLRSLVDLAADAPPALLDEAVGTALATRLVTVEGLQAEAARLRRPGRRGPVQLMACLQRRGFIGAPAPSVLERRALRLLQKAGVRVVDRETVVDGGRYRLDFQLEGQVFVEVDGYAYHSSPDQKDYDDARRNRLRLLGFNILIYGWQVVVHQPHRMLADVKQALKTTAEAT